MILLDTHVAVWLLLESSRLSKAARAAVTKARSEGEGLGISDITIWEIAGLIHKQRLHTQIGDESFLFEVESRFKILPISGRACLRALALPAAFPKDPADRLIAATALAEGVPLVTADRAIRESGALRTIW